MQLSDVVLAATVYDYQFNVKPDQMARLQEKENGAQQALQIYQAIEV